MILYMYTLWKAEPFDLGVYMYTLWKAEPFDLGVWTFFFKKVNRVYIYIYIYKSSPVAQLVKNRVVTAVAWVIGVA